RHFRPRSLRSQRPARARTDQAGSPARAGRSPRVPRIAPVHHVRQLGISATGERRLPCVGSDSQLLVGLDSVGDGILSFCRQSTQREGRDAVGRLLETRDNAVKGEESWIGAVRFFLSGSEANDLALTLSQAITGRSAIATRERAYHGMTGLSRDVTVQPHWHGGLAVHTGGTMPVPRTVEVKVLPAPIGSRYGGQKAAPVSERLAGAEALLADAAAVIVDYTRGGFSYAAP